jgi:hypothetical protein
MPSPVHVPHDVREPLKVQALRREQRNTFEERNHRMQQRAALTDDVHEGAIASTVGLDVATTKPLADEFEDFSPVAVLTDMELG